MGSRRERLLDFYAEQQQKPVDDELAVFASYWYRGVSDSPLAVADALARLAPGVRAVWVVREDAVADVPAGVEYVTPGTRRYFRALARAKVFVNNVNFPNHLVKRPGTVHVQTHHGTPLKLMGMDQVTSEVAQAKMDFDLLMERCRRWDYSLSNSRYTTDVWNRAYPVGTFESLEVGSPRNDVLVKASAAEVAAARKRLGIPVDRTTVLYAPTHREYLSGFVSFLDVARVARDLAPDALLLTRLHYFYDADPEIIRLHEEGVLRDVSSAAVADAMLVADVLVTDYSSIMFDYALLDRPIVIHAPDWEVYRQRRGTYFDLLAEPPGVVTRAEDELVRVIASGSARGDEAKSRQSAFKARFCEFDTGQASEQVVRRVWGLS